MKENGKSILCHGIQTIYAFSSASILISKEKRLKSGLEIQAENISNRDESRPRLSLTWTISVL